MNQSKARGTFEQRKAQSIERKRIADIRLEEIEAEQYEIGRVIFQQKLQALKNNKSG